MSGHRRTLDYRSKGDFMSRTLHPLFVMLMSLTQQELARQIAYLKKENEILRARLPERICTTKAERKKLLKAGRKIGPSYGS